MKYPEFVGPMVPHFGGVPPGYGQMTCGMSQGYDNLHVMRDASFDRDALDAPDYLPMGGVELRTFSRFSMPLALVSRS